jgi:hypothetical protein
MVNMNPHRESSTEEVWSLIARRTFAVLSYVTPMGEPRSSGVVYKAIGRHLYVSVAHDSWKAKHIAQRPQVAVVVPVRRGGLLSLLMPIPPATIGFHGTAVLQSAGSDEEHPIPEELASLIPAERRKSSCLIDITPAGDFVTYGVGVSLKGMLDPAASHGRVHVS